MEQQVTTLEAIELNQLGESRALKIKQTFEPMSKMLSEFEQSFNSIIKAYNKEDITPDLISDAKRLRLDISKIRIQTEKTRKTEKEEYLRAGKAIDGVANILKWAVVEKENKLKDIEQHYERLEKLRLEKLQDERVKLLSEYNESAHMMALAEMDQDVFDAYYKSEKSRHLAEIEAEKVRRQKEEEEFKKQAIYDERRQKCLSNLGRFSPEFDVNTSEDVFEKLYSDAEAKFYAHKKEQERIKQENDRLKKEAEERELKEKKAREEQEKAHQEELRKEREERERIQRELAEKKAKEEAEAKAKEEVIQKELSKGDAQKLKDLKIDLMAICDKYTFKSKKNIANFEVIKQKLTLLYKGI